MADPTAAPRLWRQPRAWLALLSLALVLTLFGWEERRTVPTPISAVHDQEPGLSGSEDCARCHGGLGQSLAEACGDCHAPVLEQLEARTGFHGRALEGDARRCGRCHVEHAGRGFPLVGEHSFERAGFASRASFDHPFEGYDLVGAHADLSCADCHPNADLAWLPAGQRRFQGLSRECLACHDDDPHEGRMQRDCEACHGQERPFVELAAFVHDERFPLDGVHEVEACVDCHEAGGEESIEALASLPELPPVRGCEACHESEHEEDFLRRAVADAAEAAPADRCILCHSVEQEDFDLAREDFDAARHLASGFSLAAPHDLACAECHDPEGSWTERFPGRAESDCAACHEDPHRGQFETSSNFPACADCHRLERFVPALFDVDEHARTDFPLAESHQAVSCVACHEPHADDPRDREWNGVARRCAGCHEDAHDGHFDARLAALGETGPSECSDCHRPSRFDDLSVDYAAEHGRWTDFELDGAHAEMECTGCHERSPRPDATARRFGRIAQVWGEAPSAPRPCVGCHADPHAVDFDAPERPTVVGGRRGCARCHDSASFDGQVFEPFDHRRWTARDLGGAHLALECRECHVPTTEPDVDGRRFGRVREVFGERVELCATCHEDPHLGLFDQAHAPGRVDGAVGCARCHGEEDFALLLQEDFDHDRWTDTDVASGHAAQGCDDCHPRLSEPGFAARARREARGRRCQDCHDDPHAGQFHEEGRVDCRSCHEDQADWAELEFDHDVDSTYPLDEVHAPLDCDACHLAYPQLGAPPVVRYKPLGTGCIDCHPLAEPPEEGGGSPR